MLEWECLTRPLLEAAIIGVFPSSSVMLISAPLSMSILTSFSEPKIQMILEILDFWCYWKR